jgi:hypothetical protein
MPRLAPSATSFKIMLMKAFFVQQADGRLINTIIRAESLEKARTYVPSDVTLHETGADIVTAMGWPNKEGRYDDEFSRIDQKSTQYSWRLPLGAIRGPTRDWR